MLSPFYLSCAKTNMSCSYSTSFCHVSHLLAL
uniref:Uncharacterized protein n=1 Tax=Arundo donax TaxID=35708 RepID=A0A0A9GQ73_ARUDO